MCTVAAPERILIVDDEPHIRSTVRDILADEGYEVKEAEDSVQCLAALTTERFDLILMDIQMPGGNGLETFKKLTQDRCPADTIMISGHGTIETAVEALKFGAHDFLEKPFSITKLKSTVKTALEKRQQNRRMETLRTEGSLFGEYRLVRKVAEGSSASVHEALHSKLGRQVALKIMHPHLAREPEAVKRFEKEARITARLSHANIVRIYDFGTQRESLYLAMEWVNGASLKNHLSRETRLPVSMALCVFAEVCGALKHAHANSVIHRDIKPTNILISKDGKTKLADFGISRCLEAGQMELTQADQIVGTPLFMSPEQINGRQISPASDLFSMGTLLYLLLTLELPFTGPNMAAILKAIAHGHYQEPNRINRSLSPELNSLVAKCLQKKADDRFCDAGLLLEGILNCPEMADIRDPTKDLENYFLSIANPRKT